MSVLARRHDVLLKLCGLLGPAKVEKYGGHVPNYRARGEQHYRIPFKATCPNTFG